MFGKKESHPSEITRVSNIQLDELREQGWDPIVVQISGETLALLKRKGINTHKYGELRPEDEKRSAPLTEVIINLAHAIPKETFDRTFNEQKKVLANMKPVEGLTFTQPLTIAEVLVIADGVIEKTGVNILEKSTRVGKDGSIIVGEFFRRRTAEVYGNFNSNGYSKDVGLLCLAVPSHVLR